MSHVHEFERILAYVRDYAPTTDRNTLTAELLDAGVDRAMVARALQYVSDTPIPSFNSPSSMPANSQLHRATRRITISLCLVEMVIQAQPFFLPRGQWPLGLSIPDQSAAAWFTLSVVMIAVVLGLIGLRARKAVLVIAFLPTAFWTGIVLLGSLAFGPSMIVALGLLPIQLRLPISLTIALTGQPSVRRLRSAIVVFAVHVLVMIGIQNVRGM